MIVHDACTLINLFATGCIEDVLAALQARHLVCSAVHKESLYLRSEDPTAKPEAVSLDALVSANQLEIVTVSTALEEQLYVDYATVLDDGEAMSLAIAIAGGFCLATDDRKGRRVFLEAAGDPSRLLSTAGILREWADRRHVTPNRLRDVLRSVTTRAKFMPPIADPDHAWWRDRAASTNS